jgi:hypothetical protein
MIKIRLLKNVTIMSDPKLANPRMEDTLQENIRSEILMIDSARIESLVNQ